MDGLCKTIKANVCGYKDRDRRLKDQFINGISDKEMVTEIIRGLTTIKETKKSHKGQ